MEAAELLRKVPDLPRWLETRSMLLSGMGEVVGSGDGGFAMADPGDGLVCVFGRPSVEEVWEAVSRLHWRRVVLCAPEDRDLVARALPDYREVRAVLHLPGEDGLRLPEAPDSVRLVEPEEFEEAESLEDLPDELRADLHLAASRRLPIAAAFREGYPVSFCYSVSRTETLFDISIETIEGFRRLGLAAMCVSRLVETMSLHGLTPVWGAEETNAASLALAGKLGFAPVDEFVVFHPTHQA
jgi:GNAT superfamily N-acetyltransferase